MADIQLGYVVAALAPATIIWSRDRGDNEGRHSDGHYSAQRVCEIPSRNGRCRPVPMHLVLRRVVLAPIADEASGSVWRLPCAGDVADHWCGGECCCREYASIFVC